MAFTLPHPLRLAAELTATPVPAGGFAIWSLGQAGLLIKNHGGQVLAIDPYLSDAIERQHPGTEFVRRFPPVLPPAALAVCEAVLITHFHDDHMDMATLEPLAAQAPALPFWIPSADARRLQQDNPRIAANVRAAKTGQAFKAGDFTILPIAAAHSDYERTADGHDRFLGYYLRCGDLSLWHSGDTLVTPALQAQMQALRPQIAVLPINGGDYARGARGIMPNMSFRDAADLHHAIGSDMLLPCHFDLFACNSDNPACSLSTLWGPRRVMLAGGVIWVIFEVLFLAVALPNHSVLLLALTYGLRGVAYPMFAYAFLVWIQAAAPAEMRGSATGWFWLAFTGGLPTLGSLVAIFSIRLFGEYVTFWLSLGLVALGVVIMLVAVKERTGNAPLLDAAHRDRSIWRSLMGGIDILWREPRISAAAVVRIINTTPYFGFFIFLPGFFTEQIGFSQTEYLSLITIMGVVGMSFNPIIGKLSDRIGWRRVLTVFGGLGSCASMLLMYFVPQWSGGSFTLSVIFACLYGITLCGYVPAAALFSSLCDPKDKGNAMAIYCFAAGLSTFFGPALYAMLNALFGTSGVVWVYALLYLVSAFISWRYLLTPRDPGEQHNPAALRLQRLNAVTSKEGLS